MCTHILQLTLYVITPPLKFTSSWVWTPLKELRESVLHKTFSDLLIIQRLSCSSPAESLLISEADGVHFDWNENLQTPGSLWRFPGSRMCSQIEWRCHCTSEENQPNSASINKEPNEPTECCKSCKEISLHGFQEELFLWAFNVKPDLIVMASSQPGSCLLKMAL